MHGVDLLLDLLVLLPEHVGGFHRALTSRRLLFCYSCTCQHLSHKPKLLHQTSLSLISLLLDIRDLFGISVKLCEDSHQSVCELRCLIWITQVVN